MSDRAAPERIYETITRDQLIAILDEVAEHHDWPMQGRKIKYVDLHYDNRTHSVFTIHFRHGGGNAAKTTFTSTNRYNSETDEMEDVRLFEEVMAWLKSGRTQ